MYIAVDTVGKVMSDAVMDSFSMRCSLKYQNNLALTANVERLRQRHRKPQNYSSLLGVSATLKRKFQTSAYI
jgi:hypothetical protein